MYVHSLTVDSERVYKMSGKLNHFDQHGNAVMVDVTDKNVTEREAVATGKIFVCDETYERILTGNMVKGDVLAVARVAGIMATKKTSELIPMCHPLMLTKAKVDFEFNEEENKLYLANLIQVNKELQEQLNYDNVDRIAILAMLTRLRQICCEPRIIYEPAALGSASRSASFTNSPLPRYISFSGSSV